LKSEDLTFGLPASNLKLHTGNSRANWLCFAEALCVSNSSQLFFHKVLARLVDPAELALFGALVPSGGGTCGPGSRRVFWSVRANWLCFARLGAPPSRARPGEARLSDKWLCLYTWVPHPAEQAPGGARCANWVCLARRQTRPKDCHYLFTPRTLAPIWTLRQIGFVWRGLPPRRPRGHGEQNQNYFRFQGALCRAQRREDRQGWR